jgi:hypothetical protein
MCVKKKHTQTNKQTNKNPTKKKKTHETNKGQQARALSSVFWMTVPANRVSTNRGSPLSETQRPPA